MAERFDPAPFDKYAEKGTKRHRRTAIYKSN